MHSDRIALFKATGCWEGCPVSNHHHWPCFAKVHPWALGPWYLTPDTCANIPPGVEAWVGDFKARWTYILCCGHLWGPEWYSPLLTEYFTPEPPIPVRTFLQASKHGWVILRQDELNIYVLVSCGSQNNIHPCLLSISPQNPRYLCEYSARRRSMGGWF